jgi:uncharacterized repeat protein (TIGR03803 family)
MNHKLGELTSGLAESVVRPKGPLLMRLLVIGLASVLVSQVSAQKFQTLHNFALSDGDQPSGLSLSGGTLYGVTPYSPGVGTVFKINTDGTSFTILYNFPFDGSEGGNPLGGVILASNVLYGTTSAGGTGGTVFRMNTDGTDFATLHYFAGAPSEGWAPQGRLVLSGNTLYGTTTRGTNSYGDAGTVFAINTDGTGFRTLHSFAGRPNEGAEPVAGLVLSGNTLYGTTYYGGSSANGTVFSVNTDGTAFMTLYSFPTGSVTTAVNIINSNGAYPSGELVLSSNTLYGTTSTGGNAGSGTVFSISTDGTGFATLHTFTAVAAGINVDGAGPVAELFLSSNTLYGTAGNGGSEGEGTAFMVNLDGTGFTTIHSFTASFNPYFTNSDGTYPDTGLILSGNTLYGTAASGGISGYGTIFNISLPGPPPQLAITPSGANVILTWPTNFTGFTLQSTTNLGSPVWSTNLPAPVVVNGQFTVTNPISGTQQFFRLSQ